MSLRSVAVASLGLTLTCTDTQADVWGHTCKTFKSPQQPIIRLESQRVRGKIMLRSCKGFDDTYLAFLLYPAEKARYGVCKTAQIGFQPKSFLDNDPTNEPIVDKSVLEWEEPHQYRVWRLVTDGSCPSQDSDDYIRTHGVTDGVFAVMVRAWHSARKSEASFDHALTGLAMTDDKFKAHWFERFKQYAIDPREPMKIYGAHVDDRGAPDSFAPKQLELRFLDPADTSKGFTLRGDFGPGGFEFLEFGTWVS